MVVISLALWASGYAQSQPPPPSSRKEKQPETQNPEEAKKQAESVKPNIPPAPIAVRLIDPPMIKVSPAEGQKESHGNASEKATAIIAALALAVAVGQLLYFRKQLKNMDATLKATENSVKAIQASDEQQLRAYVSMELNWDKVILGESFRFSFFLTNHGRTPAKEIGYRAIAECIPVPKSNLPDLPVIEGPWNQKRMTLFPDTSPQRTSEMNCNMGGVFSRDQIASVLAQMTHGFRIGIEVKYLDVFGAEHITQEFFLYSARSVIIIPGGSRIT